MDKLIQATTLMLLLNSAAAAGGLYNMSAVDINGTSINLSQFSGNVTLMVNVATFWGETPINYKQMPLVYNKYHNQGFTIIAVPCNQFMNQEPDSNQKIQEFAHSKGAYFPFLAKSNVNAPECTGNVTQCQSGSSLCCPVNNGIYEYIKSVIPGNVLWNFEKVLFNQAGIPVKRYPTPTNPVDIEPDIEKLLSNNWVYE